MSLRDSHFGFHDFWYHLQSYKMWDLISIRELPYEHTNNSLGKNLSLYLPIEA